MKPVGCRKRITLGIDTPKRLSSSFGASNEVRFEAVNVIGGLVGLPAQVPGPQYQRIVPPEKADQRLAAFAMSVAIIRRCIETGDTARGRVSNPPYPATFAGFTMWAETLTAWRKEMLKRNVGYAIGNSHGYETVYCVQLGVAFTVMAADINTGIRGKRDPRSVRDKGTVTAKRVNRNREVSAQAGTPGVQGVLIPLPTDKNLPPDETCDLWFLLVHPTRDEIRIELSRPIMMEGGLVVSYSERILLPPVPISGAVAPIAPDNGEDDDDGGSQLVGRQGS
jgi:hypothetical protein